MATLVAAFWQGLLNGSNTRDRATARQPQELGYSGSLGQGLYWLGFQVSNVVVYGARD